MSWNSMEKSHRRRSETHFSLLMPGIIKKRIILFSSPVRITMLNISLVKAKVSRDMFTRIDSEMAF